MAGFTGEPLDLNLHPDFLSPLGPWQKVCAAAKRQERAAEPSPLPSILRPSRTPRSHPTRPFRALRSTCWSSSSSTSSTSSSPSSSSSTCSSRFSAPRSARRRCTQPLLPPRLPLAFSSLHRLLSGPPTALRTRPLCTAASPSLASCFASSASQKSSASTLTPASASRAPMASSTSTSSVTSRSVP